MEFPKNISEIKAENLLIGFLILMILPFIFLFAFNHPSVDDFGAQNTKLYGFLESQIMYYKYWGGRIFSNALLSYGPVHFRSIEGYKALTLFITLLFLYILFVLISEVTKNNLKFRERLLLSLSIFFLYLYAMPSITHSFYWLSASIPYQFGLTLIMIFLVLYMRLHKNNNPSARIFYILTGSIILIAIAGSIEFAMVLIFLILILLTIVDLLSTKKLDWVLTLFILILSIASYIVISAPGNQVRGELFPESHKFFYSIGLTFKVLFEKIFTWTFYTPLLPLTILLIPVFSKIFKNNEKNSVNFSINPIYPLLIFFIFLFCITFIPIWSLGKEPYRRNLNFVFFIFLIGWFCSVIVLIFYMNKKFKINIDKFPKYLYPLAIVLIIILLVKKNNVRMAYADLLRGTAYKYDNELNERYKFILQSNSDSSQVDEIKSIPRTLFVADISTDPESVVNKLYAYYFDKKVIYLKPSEIKPYK